MTDESGPWPHGRVGYVALLGRPNVGKSTLLNTVLDYHLAAVSSKPQTTRRTCLGILSDEESQILFRDAPGVHVPQDELDEAMERSIERAVKEADVVLCIADSSRTFGKEDRLVAERAAGAKAPVLLAVNKVDAAGPGGVDAIQTAYQQILGDVPAFRICARSVQTLDRLLDAVRAALPEGPFLHDPELVSDIYEREIAEELIREALMESLREEVPHAMAVTVDQWKETDKACRITATLHVERESQKGIVIGRGGTMLNEIRAQAVRKLRDIRDENVRLKLYVRVTPDWRNRKNILRDFGLDGSV
jgi:GTP-binding protein Era